MSKGPDLTRREPLLIITQPKGSNGLTSRASFMQRKLYDLTTFTSEEVQPIDFWYAKTLYGRVNLDSQAVHLSEAFLKQIPGTPDLFAVNFVVDAFQDLRSFFAFLSGRNAIQKDSVYARLAPQNAWSSTNALYHFVMQAMFEKFKTFVISQKKEKQIRDFPSFMNIFSQFVDLNTPLLPFTRSKLVVSRMMNPRCSGLVIEIADANHGEDTPKVETYLNDDNFPIFKETAQRFGFAVDKHAPWRLVADLGSPRLRPYMEKAGVTLDTLFDKYYFTSHEVDLAALKTYIIQFYNSYVENKPILVEPKFSIVRGKPVLKNKEIVRSTKTQAEIEQLTSDEYWLRVYAFIKGREENKGWDQFEFEKIVRNAGLYSKGLDIGTGIEYIHRRTRIPTQSSSKERWFKLLSFQRLT